MKAGPFRGRSIGALIGMIALIGAMTPVSADPGGFVSDDFSAPTLDTSRWTPVDPRADATLTSTGTNLTIAVPGGVSHRLASGDRTAPRVLQTVPDVDVEVEIGFDSQPSEATQMQGLVFQQGEADLLAFGVEHDGSGAFFQVTAIAGGKAKTLLRSAVGGPAPRFLRVARTGRTWTLRASADAATWTVIDTVSRPLALTSIGPFAGNHGASGSAPAFTASVDYVFDTAAPIVPEDGVVEDDMTPPQISGVAANASRNEAVVTWTTNEPADGSVDVGTTDTYELGTFGHASFATVHSVTLPGLTCEQMYRFRITSTDPSGNVSLPATSTFDTGPCAGGEPGAFVSDELSGPSLDPGRWDVVDPNGLATVTMTGTGVAISIPSGVVHGFGSGGNRTVRLVQEVADGDVSIDVAFEATSLAGDTAFQGLLVEQDADDYLRFEISTINCQYRVHATAHAGESASTRLQRTLPTAPTHLRVARSGDTWTLSVSFDGAGWTQIGSFSHGLDAALVGPYVGSEGSAPAVASTVDYVVNRAQPFATEDGLAFEPGPDEPRIDVWYGNEQTFGAIGRPQSWVNILGNVSDPDGVSSFRYRLNGGPAVSAPLGFDPGRLVRPGDFNIEIPWNSLTPGHNVVEVTAVDRVGNTSVTEVGIELAPLATWPLPYSLDPSDAPAPTEGVQIVDGTWAIGDDGVRTVVPGYDRTIAIGETTWDSYDVSAAVTLHRYAAGPCVGPAVGLVVGWTGHTPPGDPMVGHPYGALGWHRGRLEILRNGDSALVREKRGTPLELERRYVFRLQMERTSQDPVGYTYRFKLWPASEPEPVSWSLTGSYGEGGGSVLLVAHHVDVSFDDITIVPIG